MVPLVQGEINLLQALASSGIYSEIVEFDSTHRDMVLKPSNMR